MKRVIIIMLTLCCGVAYGNSVEILDKEHFALEEKITSYQEQKEIKYSERELLGLKKSLILKNLEIIDEKSRLKRLYIQTTKELLNVVEKRKIYEKTLDDYRNRYDLSLKNREIIKESEKEELAYSIEYLKNEIRKAAADERYLKNRIEENSYIEQYFLEEKTEQREELIKKNNMMLIAISERELALLRLSSDGSMAAKALEIQIEIDKLKYGQHLKEIEEQKNETRRRLEILEGDREILTLNVKRTKKRLETLKEEVEKGLSSRDTLLKKETEYMNLKITEINSEQDIKLLKMELEL
jgi:hypothetical protein